DSQYVRLTDGEPPADRCGLMSSWRHLSLPMSVLPLGHLLHEVTMQDSDTRPIVRRGGIIPIFRHPLEAAWRQMYFIDELQRREACTRICFARGGRTLATLVFDFWPEDELRLHAAWSTMMETLAVG